MKKIIILIIVIVLFILGLVAWTYNNINKKQEQVNEYLSCYVCKISDATFIRLQNSKVFDYYNYDSLTYKEYARSVSFSSKSYEEVILPEYNRNPGIYENNILTKREYVFHQLDSDLNFKKKKLKDWDNYFIIGSKKSNPVHEFLVDNYQKLFF